MKIVNGTLYNVKNYNIIFGKYKIPDSVTEIGIDAFYNCVRLKKIDIPNSVHIINDCAFDGCKYLKSVILPKNLKLISNGAFCGCSSLEKIELPIGVERILNAAFRQCKSLQEINLPESINFLGCFVFSGCERLKNIEIPIGVEKICNETFLGCSSLQEINLPESINFLGNGAFSGCERLKNIEIPIGVEKICNETFLGCSSLQEINISDNIISIGNYTFEGCFNLKLNIETSLFYINWLKVYNTLFTCKSLTIYNQSLKTNDAVYVMTNALQDFRKIRVEELIDKIRDYLSKNQLAFKYEEHRDFIDTIVNNLETIENYNYREDFQGYIKDYVSKPKVLNNRVNKNSFVSNVNSSEISFTSNCKVIGTLKDNDVLDIASAYMDIPIDLYDYGNKVGMLNFIKEIKCEIDKILLENDITSDKYYEYSQHKGFIIEMIECVLDNKDYDYKYALDNYMKNFIDVSKQKNDFLPKKVLLDKKSFIKRK